MITIDAHTHIFPPEIIANRPAYLARDAWFERLYADPRAKLITAEQLVSSMTRARVDMAVVFGFAFRDNGLCALCNDYVIESAQRYSGQLIPFATLNPSKGAGALRLAEKALADGAVGIGELMPAGQGFELDDSQALDPLMELGRHAGAPVLLHVNEPVGHAYPGKAPIGPKEVYAMICRYPENTHILAHLGGGLPFYELMPEVREHLTRTYYDAAASPFLYSPSALVHLAGWVSDKILWGTDYPLISQSRCLHGIKEAGLSEETIQKILGENLLRILPGVRKKMAGE